MIAIRKEPELEEEGRRIGILEVHYPEPEEWDIPGFEALRDSELEKIREEGKTYDRDTVFRQDPYFRYFRKFKKTYPVMMQVESFLLKGRPFPEGEYINAVAFLTELKTHRLLGTHDIDRIEGEVVFYKETEKRHFTGMVNPDQHSYPKDVTGRDDKGIIISMLAGADDRTCIHEDSRNFIYIMFGTPNSSEDEIRETAGQVETYVRALAPTAETEFRIF